MRNSCRWNVFYKLIIAVVLMCIYLVFALKTHPILCLLLKAETGLASHSHVHTASNVHPTQAEPNPRMPHSSRSEQTCYSSYLMVAIL